MTNIKQQSTGDNDSMEDVFIAIMRLRTEDNKLISSQEAWNQVKQFAKVMKFEND